MGADLYESYVGSIVATAALAVAAGYGINGVAVPLAMAATGVVASVIGTFFVRTGENLEQAALLGALRRGVYIASVLVAVISFFILRAALGPRGLGVYWAVLVGLVAGNIIGLTTEYFTSASYKPTLDLAATSTTGAATVIISGMSVGMMSTAIPVTIVSIAILLSYYLSGGTQSFNTGLYGVGISAVGMLSTLGITLATDAYGPVADNAGGIAQMARHPKEVRERTDALDALGNTTAATGKGFAIGSAALTALALIAAYREQVLLIGERAGRVMSLDLSLLDPKILTGLLIGGMLPYVFCALTMSAVGRTAQQIVVEVRRQFREIEGLMEGTALADYATCVDICTKSAQKEMLAPSLLAIVVPVVMGLITGVEGVVGLLAGATVSGFVLAIFMANAGGSWDNAKKYTEAGAYGGKGSAAHKAAVVGDTVGDPFKDTAGPSLNILIKLVSMVSVVFAAFVITHSLKL
jgi:K(+)-stimulated pyrophosphate-energized sodium pump